MRTPILLSYPWIHADAIVAHLCREKADPEFYNLPSKLVVRNEVNERKLMGWVYGEDQQSPFPLASVYIFRNLGTTTIYKRFETAYLELLDVRKKQIDIAKGTLRNWALNFVICCDPEVEFRIVCERRWLEELFQNLTHIGKKRSIGYGQVKTVEIQTLPSCWDVLFDEHGQLRRQIPEWAVVSPRKDQLFWGVPRPPYWDKRLVQQCVKPGERVELVPNVKAQLERYDAQAR